MANFCPCCNVATDPDADFCAACGTRLTGRFKKNGGSAGRRGADASETARYLQPTVGPSFLGAPLHCLKKYCVFRGRATRTEFWGWFVPWAAVVFIAAPTVANVLTANVDDAAAWLNGFHCFWFGTTLLPSLAVFARRLHDVGKSAKRWLASVVWGGVGVALWASGRRAANFGRLGLFWRFSFRRGLRNFGRRLPRDSATECASRTVGAGGGRIPRKFDAEKRR